MSFRFRFFFCPAQFSVWPRIHQTDPDLPWVPLPHHSIIPITEAMKEPHKFPKVLTGVMIGVAALFTTFGVLGYAAYGSDIQTVVIVNLPQDKKFVQVTQFLYTVAIILS